MLTWKPAAKVLLTLMVALLVRPVDSRTQTSGPEAKYKVRVTQGVMVPMRDGVKLATDLYFPEGAPAHLPVILSRTPYNKEGARREGSAAYIFAGQGYVFAIQDVRGKFASEGEFTVSAADSNDGFDAMNWVVKQPWSNGKVGTFGCSYLGRIRWRWPSSGTRIILP